MKSKGGSLYEVLKTASRAPGADPGAPPAPDTTPVADGNQPTLQERLAAYKAAKLAAATQTPIEARPEAAVTTTKVSATTLVLEPDPTPVPAPTLVRAEPQAPVFAPTPVSRVEVEAPAAAAVGAGPGERVIKLTYNTALFGGMVAVGLLFIAYAVGLHVGKSSAPAEAVAETPRPAAPAPAPVAPVKPPAAPAVPPPVRKDYTIRLCEMKTTTSQERLKALAFAEDADLKKSLERAGHKGFEKAFITRGGEVRMALYVDRFSDNNSEAAKAALTAMKNFRFKNQTPFAQAVFEEVQPR
jgi:hypothetical protein